jgi:hypothetical protein
MLTYMTEASALLYVVGCGKFRLCFGQFTQFSMIFLVGLWRVALFPG